MKLLYWSPILGPKEKILLYIIFYALGAREQCAKLLELLWWQSCQMSDVTEVARPMFQGQVRDQTYNSFPSHGGLLSWD